MRGLILSIVVCLISLCGYSAQENSYFSKERKDNFLDQLIHNPYKSKKIRLPSAVIEDLISIKEASYEIDLVKYYCWMDGNPLFGHCSLQIDRIIPGRHNFTYFFSFIILLSDYKPDVLLVENLRAKEIY